MRTPIIANQMKNGMDSWMSTVGILWFRREKIFLRVFMLASVPLN